MSRIRLVQEYPHPVAKVWKALTTREALAVWLMPNDFEPRVGHTFTFHTEPAPGFDGTVHCEVLAINAERFMLWSWRGGPIDTELSFELEPTPRGTRLTLEQTGFEGLRGWMIAGMLGRGSRRIYRQILPRYLDLMDEDARLVDPEGFLRMECGSEGWFLRLFQKLFPQKAKDRET